VADSNSFPIVIVGGGFAGAYCGRALRARLGQSASKEVALVADQNVLLFHPMLAEVSGSSVSPLHVVNPLRQFCRGTSIFMGSVEEVDLEKKTMRFVPGPFVNSITLTFEHLVLAMGSIVDVSRVPGMPEHGYLMKTVGDAIRLRADLLQRLEEASATSDDAVRRKLLTFVVVGGGYSGVETAGQIWDLLRDVKRFYPRIDPKEFRLVLVHSGPYLLPQIGKELGSYCEKQLKKRGIDVRLDARVTAITAERAILNTGELIETNTVVTTVGNATHPVIKDLIDRYQLSNQKGRLLVDSTLLVKGWQNLWAAGDCAAVPLPDGTFAPATAQFAIRQGMVLAQNILAQRASRPLKIFHYKTLGEMASLGHLNAVGKILGFKVSGLLAWLMWRATYLAKLPGLERKIKVFIEWNMEVLFPRDISLLDVKTTEVIGRVHLEKGDPVYHVGDPAFSFYLVEKGRVEIVDDSGTGRVLTAGEHFGERELLQNLKRQFTATALEPTTLLALDKSTFEALAKNSLALGYLLSRSSVKYLTLDERKAMVNRAPTSLRAGTVADLMQPVRALVREDDSVYSAFRIFKQAGLSMMPVVDSESHPKGWLRLDVVFDLLHHGKITVQSAVRELLVLPFVSAKREDNLNDILLQFAQTSDREFIVVDDDGQLIGTLPLIDLVLATEGPDRPSD